MIKDRFEAYAQARRTLRRKQARLLELTNKLDDPGHASRPDSVTVKQPYNNLLPEELTELDELKAELLQLTELDQIQRAELKRVIALLSEYESAVLEYHYLEAIDDWAVVARRVFGIREDFREHRNYYINRCYRLHSQGFKILEEKAARVAAKKLAQVA